MKVRVANDIIERLAVTKKNIKHALGGCWSDGVKDQLLCWRKVDQPYWGNQVQRLTLLNILATRYDLGPSFFKRRANIQNISSKVLTEFRHDHLGFVFQDFNLLETLSVYDVWPRTRSSSDFEMKQSWADCANARDWTCWEEALSLMNSQAGNNNVALTDAITDPVCC